MDIITLKPVREETVDILTKYKEFKEEQTKGKEEPWWLEMVDGLQIQGDVVKGLGAAGKGLMASTLVSGIGSLGVGAVGIKDLRQGIKDKDFLKAFGGTTAIMASLSGGTDVISNTIKSHKLFENTGAGIAEATGKASQVFGVAFGTMDLALGTRELVHGIKEKNRDKIIDGSLEMGIGGTYIASSLGFGGTALAAALGGLYVSKVIYDYREELLKLGKKIIGKEDKGTEEKK